VIVNQAYRFALDPTPAQVAALASHAGASRKAFNWALGLVKAQMDQRAAEKTYGLTGDQLTPSVSWTLPSLRKAWNEAKAEVAPWWAENSKEAYACGIRNLVRGLDAWRDPAGFRCFRLIPDGLVYAARVKSSRARWLVRPRSRGLPVR